MYVSPICRYYGQLAKITAVLNSKALASYTSDTYLSDLGGGARKKMRIDFTGGEIESGVNYSFSLLMPQVVITNAEAAVDRAGKIAHPVTMDLLAPPAEVSGMSGVAAPLAIDLVNTAAAGLLA